MYETLDKNLFNLIGNICLMVFVFHFHTFMANEIEEAEKLFSLFEHVE